MNAAHDNWQREDARLWACWYLCMTALAAWTVAVYYLVVLA